MNSCTRKNKTGMKQLLIMVLMGLVGLPVLHAQEVLPTGYYPLTEQGSFRFFDSASQQYIFIDTPAICTVADFRKVSVGHSQLSGNFVEVTLTHKGAQAFAAATQKLIGNRLAIILDGQLESTPLVQQAITGGRVQLAAGQTAEEVQEVKEWLDKQIPAANRSHAADPKEEAALIQICQVLDSVMMSRDTNMLKQLLHPMLSMGHSNGWLENKEDMLFSIGSGTAVYDDIYEIGVPLVKIDGEVAMLRRLLRVKGLFKGHPYSVELQVLEVWKKQENQWQLFARQSISEV